MKAEAIICILRNKKPQLGRLGLFERERLS